MFADMIALPFMQNALVAGVMLALMAGFLGVFFVQRGLSFLGDGLAHAAFGGVALGLLLGTEPLWVAIPATVLVAVAITVIPERTGLANDVAIGVFFSVSMALGIFFLSRVEDYTNDAYSYLFGSILAISTQDLLVLALVMVAFLLCLPLWRRWAYATFDRELALSDRVPVLRDDIVLSVMTAVTVVIAIKILGVVLVSAFLVIPAATAQLLTRRFSTMTLVSTALGTGSVIAGLMASYAYDVPSGAAIVLVQGALFAAVAVLGRRWVRG